ncbi:Transcriptional regulator, TetR family [gamma proteobacterium IMCC1989]|nr:Transcriptional regulator, TetR family [gamma proteobacterium IMCC1989]
MVGTRKFNEEEILSIVINVFRDKGYTATTMLDLAKETGVQRGSLYNAYKNKNTLFLKAFDYYTQQFLEIIEKDLAHPDAKIAFTQLFANSVNRLMADEQKRGCFSTRTIMESIRQCPDIQQCLSVFLDGLQEKIHERLMKAHDEGEFLGEPLRYARYLVALTRGVAVIEQAYSDKEHMADIYNTAIAQMPFRK